MDETSNDASAKEEAEGSRENVNLGPNAGKPDAGNGAENPMERGSGQVSKPEKPLPKDRQPKDRDHAGS